MPSKSSKVHCFLNMCSGKGLINKALNLLSNVSPPSKMLWVCSLLHDMDIDAPTPMQIVCDNQATIVFYMSIPNISRLTITLFEIY